jgi:hypothetical protein
MSASSCDHNDCLTDCVPSVMSCLCSECRSPSDPRSPTRLDRVTRAPSPSRSISQLLHPILLAMPVVTAIPPPQPTVAPIMPRPHPPPHALHDSPDDLVSKRRSLAYSTPTTVRSLRSGYELARHRVFRSCAGPRAEADQGSGETGALEPFESILPQDFLPSALAGQLAARNAALHQVSPDGKGRDVARQKQQAEEKQQVQQSHLKNASLVKLLQTEGGAQLIIQHLINGGSFLMHCAPLSTVAPTRTISSTSETLVEPPTNANPTSPPNTTSTRPQSRMVWVSSDLKLIYCGESPRSRHPPGYLPVDQILVIFSGHQTRTFKEHLRAHAEEEVGASSASSSPCVAAHCFSLITSSRTLDLECSSESERDVWVLAFQFLLDYSRSGGVVDELAPPGCVPSAGFPQHTTLAQALESMAASEKDVPEHGASDDSISSSNMSPEQPASRLLSSSSTLSGASSSASSLNSTPAFGSPMTSPQLATRSLLALAGWTSSPSGPTVLDGPPHAIALEPPAHRPSSGSSSLGAAERRKSFASLEPLAEKEEGEDSAPPMPLTKEARKYSVEAEAAPGTGSMLLLPRVDQIRSADTSPLEEARIVKARGLMASPPSHSLHAIYMSISQKNSNSPAPIETVEPVTQAAVVAPRVLPSDSAVEPTTEFAKTQMKPSPPVLSAPVLSPSPPSVAQVVISTPEIVRLRSQLKRERHDHAHLRVWVAHRFLHLQSHINSLMIEKRKLIAQHAAQEAERENEFEREIQRVMGAQPQNNVDLALLARRCKSSAR